MVSAHDAATFRRLPAPLRAFNLPVRDRTIRRSRNLVLYDDLLSRSPTAVEPRGRFRSRQEKAGLRDRLQKLSLLRHSEGFAVEQDLRGLRRAVRTV